MFVCFGCGPELAAGFVRRPAARCLNGSSSLPGSRGMTLEQAVHTAMVSLIVVLAL